MFTYVRQSLAILHRVEDGVLVSALLTMLGVALFQIVLRNVFDTGLTWADPFVRRLILWVTMLGAMVATREQSHIAIDVVSRFMGSFGRTARVARVVFSAGVCSVGAWYSWEFLQYEREDGTIAFGIVPEWICQLLLPIGFAVMAIRFIIAAFLQPRSEV